MNLRWYVDVLRRRKWPVLAIVALSLAGTWASGSLAPPERRYQATATLLVMAAPGQPPPYPIEAIRSLSMAREVVRRTGVGLDPAVLVGDLSVSPRTGTSLVDVRVLDTDPERAARLANGFAQAYLDRLRRAVAPEGETLEVLRRAHEELRREAMRIAASGQDPTSKEWDLRWLQVRDERLAEAYAEIVLRGLLPGTGGATATLLDPARPPEEPIESAMAQQARTIGGVLGAALVGAIALAFLLEHLDDRLHTEAEAERALRMPVLATLPSRGRMRRTIRRSVESMRASEDPGG